jgi:hypothetical protein
MKCTAWLQRKRTVSFEFVAEWAEKNNLYIIFASMTH